ncbi:MAG: tetratricopeptide repeat protein [Gemmatimonadales bacterium]
MASLLQRLKERKLFQWALAYLAGAWLVFQGIEVLAEPWNLSQSIIRAIHVLLGIGFILALVLAWYHGERGRQRVSGPELLMVAALLVIAGAALSLVRVGSEAPSTSVYQAPPDLASDKPAIAVLPCDNMSPNPEDAYLADGIHDEILLRISKIRSLTSIGRKSVEWYRDNPRPIREIAVELGVGYVGECSLRKDAERNRIRLTFQLLDAGTGGQVWAENYDRDLTAGNLLEMESDVAQQVARAVRAVLTPEERARIEVVPTENLEAYDYYLRGRHFWNQRSLAAFDSAIDYYNRAVLLDPEYARAYAGLAETYVLLPEYGGPAIPDVLPLAKAATERALSLDPGLAEAYAASGYLKAVFEWDRDSAEQDLLKAIELNPDCATAHYWYAEVLGVTRRWDEALEEARRALELDPLSAAAHGYLGLLLMDSGRSDEAIPVIERSLDIGHYWENTVYLLATAHVLRGDYTAAAPLYDRLAELTGTDPEVYRAFLAALSDPSKTPAAVAALQTSNVYGEVGSSDYLALLGRSDEALAALEQAYEARRPYLPWVNAHIWYERLRSDPRFQDLLRRMNFPD